MKPRCSVYYLPGVEAVRVSLDYTITNTGDVDLQAVVFRAEWYNWKGEVILENSWTEDLLSGYYNEPLHPGESIDCRHQLDVDGFYMLSYENWWMEMTSVSRY